MKNQKFTVNMGYCQGMMQGNVFRQKNSVAKFNVAVRSDRKNPKTNKKDVHVLNFTMYGEAAENLHLLCGDRDRVFVTYHLESRVKVNRKTGVGECVEEYVADSVIVRNIGENDRLPTLNRGYLECEFLDITEIIFLMCVLKIRLMAIECLPVLLFTVPLGIRFVSITKKAAALWLNIKSKKVSVNFRMDRTNITQTE